MDSRDFLKHQLLSEKNDVKALTGQGGLGSSPDSAMKRPAFNAKDIEGKNIMYRGRQFQDITQRYQNR